ncbi:hypothetical protein [Arcobacter defluvii]|uniref:Uncharacterized protein n=1 Tax=Arcobacter defluvii TaxID=873191 RepID=A0AAE7BEX7_9BACT|nr:hypothetical protein [Arcobacter defluvii]QKF77298.1 hypothetical protein ADFLV_1266 [Arcobacter defluvii]QKF77858.1 hypothetical protein ADFLV_1840 [Arcobacter defluvii]
MKYLIFCFLIFLFTGCAATTNTAQIVEENNKKLFDSNNWKPINKNPLIENEKVIK